MSSLAVCNCQAFSSQKALSAGIGQKVRRLARATAITAVLMLGSAVVVTSWMPNTVQPLAEAEPEFYLQTPGSEAAKRQSLSDSISASTVIGPSIR